MPGRSDRPSVGQHDDEHLRRFVAARADGDADAMRRWWEEIVISFYDRMDAIVGVTHKGRLNDEEHETAVQLALIRFSERLIETFDGASMGELVNATNTLARGICIDVQRASVRRNRRQRSLDSGWEGDDEERSANRWEADEALAQHERDETRTDIQAFLEWALPQLRPARRAVLEQTFHGAELAEICAELGLSRDNAYQLRSRGFKDLAKLKEQYES